MKVNQSAFPGKARSAAAQCRTFFFCGPDEAGSSAAAAQIHSLLPDPGERIELAGADIKRDPVLLSDEARSSSLFGDSRHIYVRATGEEAHDALKIHLEGEGDACPVLIVATSATDKSRTAKLLANRDDALVAMFYPPDLRSMTGTVRDLADRAGLRLEGDMAERIARASGLDQRLAAAEIEKLSVYLDSAQDRPAAVTRDVWDEIGAKTEEDGFMPIVNVALSGRPGALPAEIARMEATGTNPVTVLLAIERRVAQLSQLAARLGRNNDVSGFVAAEKQARRIFFKEARDIEEQLTTWRGANLDRLVARLTALHRKMLSNSQQAGTLLRHELTHIARVGARGRGRS
ncbi:DNA polymerase III subunit delta [Altererythrobacter sp. MTPC7]|uniref:DNA polymerase III subunit delta n=1 Tax=Altererythrobacter sp. MTPC7 TaxID=3056567 RepID=UPI0036F3C652